VSTAEPVRNVRDPALDSLRGVAILMVLTAHAFPHLVIAGFMGVSLFFVLSGYLIGGNLMDRQGDADYFSSFYLRRAARILPLYLIVLLASPVPLSQPLWHYLTFTQNFWLMADGNWQGWDTVTWSLAIEEQFYLLAPLLVWCVPRRRLPLVLLALAAAAPGFRLLTNTIGTVVFMPCRMDALAGGMLAAWLVRHRRLSPSLVGITCSLSAIAYCWVLNTSEYRDSEQLWLAGYSLEALVAACLILSAVAITHWRGNAVLGWFGVHAYGLYLAHSPLIAWTGSTVLGVLLSVPIAVLSWRYVEQPAIAWAREFLSTRPTMTRVGLTSP